MIISTSHLQVYKKSDWNRHTCLSWTSRQKSTCESLPYVIQVPSVIDAKQEFIRLKSIASYWSHRNVHHSSWLLLKSEELVAAFTLIRNGLYLLPSLWRVISDEMLVSKSSIWNRSRAYQRVMVSLDTWATMTDWEYQSSRIRHSKFHSWQNLVFAN